MHYRWRREKQRGSLVLCGWVFGVRTQECYSSNRLSAPKNSEINDLQIIKLQKLYSKRMEGARSTLDKRIQIFVANAENSKERIHTKSMETLNKYENWNTVHLLLRFPPFY